MLHRLGANRWKGGAAIFKDPGLRLAVSGFPGYEFQGVGFRPSPLEVLPVICCRLTCDFPPAGDKSQVSRRRLGPAGDKSQVSGQIGLEITGQGVDPTCRLTCDLPPADL